MIKKIRTIKNLAVFQDFIWNRDVSLKEFKKINIIYGGNYSGKTTISRIFSSIRDKKVHDDYQGCSYEIEMYDGTFLTSIGLETSRLEIAVFNRDYIESNLKISKESTWQPIEFDIGGNVDIRADVDRIDKKKERSNIIIQRLKQTTDIFDKYESEYFTNYAKLVRQSVNNNTSPFDKYHFKKIRDIIGRNIDSVIIPDGNYLDNIRSLCLSLNQYPQIETISYKLKYNDLKEEVRTVLLEEPPKDLTIDLLDNNTSLYKWVQDGLNFDENKSTCAFCGNKVTEQRWLDLNAYYSNASKILRDKISKIKQNILNEIDITSKLDIPKSKMDFSDTVRNNIEQLLKKQKNAVNKYQESLLALIKELERKEDGLIHISTVLKDTCNLDDTLPDWIKEMNSNIDQHNEFVNNFDNMQTDARDKYSKHLVAIYLKAQNYYSKYDRFIRYNTWIDRLYSLNIALNKEKDILLNSLKTITLGKEHLDKYISRFLNRDDITVSITNDDKFRLMRGDSPANNLSDGEKTAICFSYFMVTLESMRIVDLMNCIIFIDDPISSLDNNHISQVYSLLYSFFFRNNLDPSNLDRYVPCFDQLFISTHNFDFFCFLKDFGKNRKVNARNLYLINRSSNDCSSIVNLPMQLSQFSSEYVYLFSVIHKYKTDSDNSAILPDITIPNAIRRFLEIYTLLKLPGANGGVEKRLEIICGGFSELKTLHHLSHFTSLEKVTRFDDIIMNLPQACSELYSILEKDEQHFESLKSALTR